MANLRDLIGERTAPADLAGLLRGKSFDIDLGDLGLMIKRKGIFYPMPDDGSAPSITKDFQFYDHDIEVPFNYALAKLREEGGISSPQENSFYQFFDNIAQFMKLQEARFRDERSDEECAEAFEALKIVRDKTFEAIPSPYVKFYDKFHNINVGFLNDDYVINRDFRTSPARGDVSKGDIWNYLHWYHDMLSFGEFYTGIDQETMQRCLPNGVQE